MADSNDSQPISRSTKLVSEALLNEKVQTHLNPHLSPWLGFIPVLHLISGVNGHWDRAISSVIIRSSLGLSFGVVFSVLLFKRRAWPAWVGLGFGAGRAWEEADASFRRGDSPVRDALRR
ncbi:hypothetical protein BJX70DRAFT_397387 [Aspergillus crustosus]